MICDYICVVDWIDLSRLVLTNFNILNVYQLQGIGSPVHEYGSATWSARDRVRIFTPDAASCQNDEAQWGNKQQQTTWDI